MLYFTFWPIVDENALIVSNECNSLSNNYDSMSRATDNYLERCSILASFPEHRYSVYPPRHRGGLLDATDFPVLNGFRGGSDSKSLARHKVGTAPLIAQTLPGW